MQAGWKNTRVACTVIIFASVISTLGTSKEKVCIVVSIMGLVHVSDS